VKMKKALKKYQKFLFFIVAAMLLFALMRLIEGQQHYSIEQIGKVVGKERIPPKRMPELILEGVKEKFLIWKWEGIEYDSVKIGDSIVKRKNESDAYWYIRKDNGTFQMKRLRYWTR